MGAAKFTQASPQKNEGMFNLSSFDSFPLDYNGFIYIYILYIYMIILCTSARLGSILRAQTGVLLTMATLRTKKGQTFSTKRDRKFERCYKVAL